MHAYDEAYEPFIFLLSLLGSLPCLDGKKPNQCNVLTMPSQRFGDLKKNHKITSRELTKCLVNNHMPTVFAHWSVLVKQVLLQFPLQS